MNAKDKLYDAFGELLYVLAMADGEVQQEEVETLKSILAYHPWSKEIKWSFNYEAARAGNLEDTYKKVIFACVDIGPDPEYGKMIEVMKAVAESSLGIDEQEQEIIERFENDLLTKFRNQ